MNTNNNNNTATTANNLPPSTYTPNNNESRPKDKTISILIVSDIHLSFNNIKRLNKEMVDNNKNIDLIICSGDVCNFDPVDSEDLLKVSACEGEMSNIYTYLHNIHKNIIYIPGNHDAKTTLLFPKGGSPPKLTTHSNNIHKNSYRLDDDLVLVGLGGSLPSIRNNENHWAGYPYQTEQEVETDLTETFEASKQQQTINSKSPLKTNDKIVLLTHMGPYNSSTTIDQIECKDAEIYSGSKSINKFILENQSQIFLNIHGHTHHATGMARVGKTYVVNPGSVRSGHYVILTLEKYCGQLWRTKSTEFFKL
ncbi:hypothetical protein DICPUDRAFT_154099 [Dictyostelium purpureum]|uniref:Calcineurin-like phosphoesterase domain-containing protein n=1 Tax=Dictyostelium purpureum TaxID=5786 RepID=F0ZQK5_DICPU|nr:uncharacterized protein DICPUDRAFT_154099 [Dictyostelium purpureum]EGC33782.1 hypothetical protein DICPUDRAFT_154099 [Dictyostelium purpureum]|eukprot:XP_003289707.1 hypothetical protein DICPUDRAFT_154099 [Dictyostelium purpureum]